MSVDYDTSTDLPGLRAAADNLEPFGGLDDIGANVALDHGPGTQIRVHSLTPMTLGAATRTADEINTYGDWGAHATAVMLVPAALYRQLQELDRWMHSTYHETAAALRDRDGIEEPTVGRGISPASIAEFARKVRNGEVPRCGDTLGGDAA